jgi:hypothetical protein
MTSCPIYDRIEWISLDGSRRSPPPGKYLGQLEFTGPVGFDMPTEGIHDFEIVRMGRKFRAEAEHHPAHKQWTYRVIEPCPQCGSEDCCSAVREDYQIDVPAKTYWNVLNEKAEG